MEVGSKAAKIHASAPAEATPTKQHFSVKEIRCWSCEEYHESVNYREWISDHHDVSVICKIFDRVSDTVVGIIHFFFRGRKSIHEADSRPLKSVDNRYQDQEDKAPVVMILACFGISNLTHFCGENFQLSCGHTFNLFIELFFLKIIGI